MATSAIISSQCDLMHKTKAILGCTDGNTVPESQSAAVHLDATAFTLL